jgi:hypothetical protein
MQYPTGENSMNLLPIFANILLQSDEDLFASGGLLFPLSCCGFIFFILVVAGWWKTFEKAGQPGWAAIIPIYNLYILMHVAGRPGWWFLLYFIPFVNIVISLLVAIDVAKSFAKDTIYGVLLLWNFLPWAWLGYLLIGFGDAQYVGPAAKQI